MGFWLSLWGPKSDFEGCQQMQCFYLLSFAAPVHPHSFWGTGFHCEPEIERMLLYKPQSEMILNVVSRVLSLTTAKEGLSFLSFGSYSTGSQLNWITPKCVPQVFLGFCYFFPNFFPPSLSLPLSPSLHLSLYACPVCTQRSDNMRVHSLLPPQGFLGLNSDYQG